MVHELLLTKRTEKELERSCVKVGQHLYIRAGEQIELGPVSSKEVRRTQIVFSMGGSGKRLLHITGDRYSKHMIVVSGRPLSQYVFDLWRGAGFRNFCLLIDDSHRGKSISDYYGDGRRFGVKNCYSIERGRLGSGGALRLALERGVIKDSFIAHYPDDMIVGYEDFPTDLFRLFKAVIERGYLILVVCIPGAFYGFGEVVDRGGRVVDFIEKPFIKKDSSIGVYGYSKEVFSLIKEIGPDKEVKIERTVFKKVARAGKMFKVMLPSEYWIPVNDENGLRKFEEVSRFFK